VSEHTTAEERAWLTEEVRAIVRTYCGEEIGGRLLAERDALAKQLAESQARVRELEEYVHAYRREVQEATAEFSKDFSLKCERVRELEEALELFGEHQPNCLAGQWQQGRPTADGGYETQYGYGNQARWFRHPERPECSCGLIAALGPLPETDEEGARDEKEDR
jgi:hypothetical protein